LILVISGDIYSSIVRHGYDGIDQHAFHPLVRVQVAGKRHPGWIHIPRTSDTTADPDGRLPTSPCGTAANENPFGFPHDRPTEILNYLSIPTRLAHRTSGSARL
jgi:hypothetical protein